MKDLLRSLFLATLRDLDVAAAMEPAVDDLRAAVQRGEQLLVLAYGKAARAMARAVAEAVPHAALRGLVVPPEPDDAPLPPFEVIAGGHPVPTAGSLRAGRRALQLAASARREDTVVFLASGGGSALLEAPLDELVTLADLQALHAALVGSGAGIVAINTVRKHLSAVKGGRLARLADAARRHETYEIRDVPFAVGAAVASGPSGIDPSTDDDLRSVLDRFHLWSAVPACLRRRLAIGDLPPRLTPNTPWTIPTVFTTLSCELNARAAMRWHAEAAGCLVVDDDSTDDLPYERAAALLLQRLERKRRRHPGRTVAVVASGELSVPLPPETGVGGRNQQFVLACARHIRGRPISVLSCGTDGIDGNSPAAGGLADGTTMARARAFGLDVHAALDRCAAFPLLHALGDTVVTGPTGTNVRDLRLLVHR